METSSSELIFNTTGSFKLNRDKAPIPSLSSLLVAEKRSVCRSDGKWDNIALIDLENPRSRILSASSRTRSYY